MTSLKSALQGGLSSALSKLAHLLQGTPLPSESPAPREAPREKASSKETQPKTALAQEAAKATKGAQPQAFRPTQETTHAQGALDAKADAAATKAEEQVADAKAAKLEAETKQAKSAKHGQADGKNGLDGLFRESEVETIEAAGVAEAWVAETTQQEEAKSGRGFRTEDVLGKQYRCHGTLTDGTRCLRRPVHGGSFCLEHTSRVAGELGGLDALDALSEANGVSEAEGAKGVNGATGVSATEEVTSPSVPAAGSVITD